MKGWKVIRKDRTSAISSIHSIRYPKGVEVKPKLKGSKLFFFTNKNDACYFVLGHAFNRIVVPCIAKGVSTPKYVCSLSSEYSFDNFWKFRSKVDRWKLTPALKGTRFADSITCLE